MAALAMDYSREPEMARFIDTHKFDQDMSTKRDKFGGGTSLPLNSDGYENKQQQLRDERHIDWMRQQEKQKESEKQKFEARRQAQPTGAPAAGPQIDYDRNNEMAKQEDRKAYQDYMKAKEERYWAMRGRPVTPPGGLNIGSYERHQKETAEQKKKEYKEMLDQQQREHMYLKARQEPEVAVMDRSGVREQYLASKPPAGPGFRPRDEAFKTSEPQNRRPIPERPRHGQPPYHGERENDAEKVVYKAVDQVEPQGQEPRQGQGHPPQGQSQRGPGNLYSDEKTRTPPEWLKNDAYSNSLQRPVDSNQSVIGTPLAFKTPYRPIQQHPARPSPLPDNSYSQNQRPIYNELDPTSQRARSRGSPDQGRGSRRSYEAERRPGGQGQEEMNDKSPRRKKQSLYNDNEDVLAKRDKANKERQEEYNEYIKMKQNEERRRQEETRQPVGKPAERVRSPHYSSDDYESWRRKEQQKLGKEYQDYLKERRTQLRDPHDHFVFPTVAAAERPIVAHMGRDVEQRKVDLRSERQRDYEQYQQQHKSQSPGRRHDFVDTAQGPYNGGLFQGLGQRGPDKDGLNQQRKHEYNERLDQNVDRGRSPQRNPGPGGADQYSRMLEEKRREEASRRRFDDPEFQGRLPQSRERDNANKQ